MALDLIGPSGSGMLSARFMAFVPTCATGVMSAPTSCDAKSYNHTIARVRVDGEDLGATFIAMGAARPWLRHQRKPDWCS